VLFRSAILAFSPRSRLSLPELPFDRLPDLPASDGIAQRQLHARRLSAEPAIDFRVGRLGNGHGVGN